MLVLAGYIGENISVIADSVLGTASIPSWMYSKIYPFKQGSEIIMYKDMSVIDSGWNKEDLAFYIAKSGASIVLYNQSPISTTAEQTKYFRIQFDLLIDNE